MSMCLKAHGVDADEDIVNKVMGAKPMQGATWEQALATSQHFGMRATLVVPATLTQVRNWTDKGTPVMIAWNPEGRDWSHASVVFDVTDTEVHVADPNIPDPSEVVRVVTHADFYKKWFEKWPSYIVRRPAMAIEREITLEGRQMVATTGTSFDWRGFARDLLKTLQTKVAETHIHYVQGEEFSGTIEIDTVWEHVRKRGWNDNKVMGVIDTVAARWGLTGRGQIYRTPKDKKQINVNIVAGADASSLKERFKVANDQKQDIQVKGEKIKIDPKDLPKRRIGPDVFIRPGAGTHHTRERDIEEGRSRKPKHKKDYRDVEASVLRVAGRHLGEE